MFSKSKRIFTRKGDGDLNRENLNYLYFKSWRLLDLDIYPTVEQQCDVLKNKILNYHSLNKDEKTYLTNRLQRYHDNFNVTNKIGKTRKCENCKNLIYAIQYCEHCIKTYLQKNFGTWSSGNVKVDKKIQNAQMNTVCPDEVIEWIPFNSFRNIQFLAKGGFATVFKAIWKEGSYDKWNPEIKELQRIGEQWVVLKKLENSNQHDSIWFNEVTSHFTIDKIAKYLVSCYGLTRDPETGDFMLVLDIYDCDLRNYLRNKSFNLTWEQRYNIVLRISFCLYVIHKSGRVHRDLHSGNILISGKLDSLRISDLGFCGPVEKDSDSIYGNLPYIAPEVLNRNPHTTKADIYSLGIIMWEVLARKHPFDDIDHNNHLMIDIFNGLRPPIPNNTPQEYTSLMQKCWNNDPESRPDGYTVYITMCTMLKKLLEAKDSGISEENYFFGRNLSVDTYFSDAFSLNNFSVCNHYSKFYSFINLLKRVESNEEHNYDYSNIDKDPHPKKRNRLTISISDSKSSTLIVKEFSEYQ